MVVALDLERDRQSLAEVDDARVLAGPLEDAGPLGGQAFQEEGRVLVAAVLGPQEREDRQLEPVRVALEQLDDPVELRVGEAERAVEGLRGDRCQVLDCSAAPGRDPGCAGGRR
jgi:hypothetical protein